MIQPTANEVQYSFKSQVLNFLCFKIYLLFACFMVCNLYDCLRQCVTNPASWLPEFNEYDLFMICCSLQSLSTELVNLVL